MTRAEVFVGIDVSKARLDVALGFAGESTGLHNDARWIAEPLAACSSSVPS